MKKFRFASTTGLVVLTLALGWWRGWFADEPVYHGRTVTAWLDSMALFDEVRDRDSTGQSSYTLRRPPGSVMSDPAISAIIAIGPRALPVLKTYVVERPTPEPWWRNLAWYLQTAWMRAKDTNSPPFATLPPRYTSRTEARSIAAGLALLAIGKEHGGGVVPIVEEIVKTAGQATGKSFRNASEEAIETALTGFPERRTEVADGIETYLGHSDPHFRAVAARNATAYRFPERSYRWQPALIGLAATGPAETRDAAMFALLSGKPSGDPRFMAVCAKILTNTADPRLLRARAASGLGMNGRAATAYVPLLATATKEPDAYVRNAMSRALRDIQKASGHD